MGSQPQSWRLLWNKWRVGSAGSTITIMSAQTSKFWRWCRTARRSCLIKKAPLRTDVTDQVLCSWQVYFVNNAKRYLSFIDCAFNQVLPPQLNVDDIVKGRSIVVLSVWWCKGWPLWEKPFLWSTSYEIVIIITLQSENNLVKIINGWVFCVTGTLSINNLEIFVITMVTER